MNRRKFISLCAPVLVIPSTIKSNETTQSKLMVMRVHSGQSVGSAINHAVDMSRHTGCEVVFVFNYIDHFRVKPDGTWTCNREGGGMPVCGPDSEFVPKEGWSEFYGH